jgi:hypothetical protein
MPVDLDKSMRSTDPSHHLDGTDRPNNLRSRSRPKSQEAARKLGPRSSMPGSGGPTTSTSRPSDVNWGVHGINPHSTASNVDRIELGAVRITTVTITDAKGVELQRKLREREDHSGSGQDYAADVKHSDLVPHSGDDESMDNESGNSPRLPRFSKTGDWRNY